MLSVEDTEILVGSKAVQDRKGREGEVGIRITTRETEAHPSSQGREGAVWV